MATTWGPDGSSGATYPGYNFVTTTGVFVTGGGGGNSIVTNGRLLGQPFAPTNPLDGLLQHSGRNKVSPVQYERLMNHQYVPMDESDLHSYCLLCFALDTYRTKADHEYVIHEE